MFSELTESGDERLLRHIYHWESGHFSSLRLRPSEQKDTVTLGRNIRAVTVKTQVDINKNDDQGMYCLGPGPEEPEIDAKLSDLNSPILLMLHCQTIVQAS